MNGIFSLSNITTFFLILMCTQYIPIEGYAVSYLKFTFMCMSPFIWMMYTPKISRAFVWGGLYILTTIGITIVFHPETFRLSTIGYMCSFISTFIMFYNLIYRGVFTLDYFIRLLKGFIWAYFICLILQQIAKIIGFQSLPLINMMRASERSLLTANSLALEQSHSARILTVVYLVLLRMYEVKWGKDNVTINRIYREGKWIIIAFLWSMLTMGSGTAFVGLSILALYFLQKKYVIVVVPLFFLFYIIVPYVDYEPLQRAHKTLEVTLTGEQENIKKVDHSASARIIPLMNTLHMDLTKKETWFGRGIDVNKNVDYLGKDDLLLGVSSWGIVGYSISLIFMFFCCIKKILSLETLIFIVLLAASIINVAYIWGILMLFATSRYFIENGKLYNYSSMRL